ncbi:MAG: LacI family DNA-binding transcriptional regulator [Clostridia bacterium]|nr:LacI family DNA-binding transcriptional regulator [Clostridia bacterium]
MSIKISDVAKIAGVSPSTVSRALTKPDLVKAQTRKRVLEIVKELSYTPNPFAQGLTTGKTNMIGLITPNLNNTFFAQLAEGCEETMRKNGYHLVIGNSLGDSHLEYELIKTFVKKMVDGIIMAGSLNVKDIVNVLGPQRDLPVTFVNYNVDLDSGYDSVLVDDTLGGRLACQALLEAGAKKMAVITGPPRNPYTKRRYGAFVKELENYHIQLEPDCIVQGDYGSIYSGYEAMSKLLALKEKPDGVFTLNDTLAIGAIKSIHNHGLKIPGEISVVGFDDIPISSYLVPSLTTISSQSYELGKEAAATTITRIKNPYKPPEQIILPVKMVKRESCKSNSN